MRGLRWAVMGATLVAGTALAKQGGTAPRQQPGQLQQGQMQPGQAAGEISAENWIGELMVVNSWALELSQSVQEKAATPQVKQFARNMVQQHQQHQQRLERLAEAANVELPVQSAVQGIQGLKEQYLHAALLTSLQGIPMLNGANVDRAYLASMVLAHDLAINKLQWAMGQVENQKLQQAATDVLNSLAQNRQQAYRLLGQVAPQVKRGQARQAPPGR